MPLQQCNDRSYTLRCLQKMCKQRDQARYGHWPFEIFRWIYSVQTKEQKSRPVTPSSWISLACCYLPLNPDEWFALHAWTPHLGWFVWWTPRRLSLLKQTRPQSHGQKVHHPRCWKWKKTQNKLQNCITKLLLNQCINHFYRREQSSYIQRGSKGVEAHNGNTLNSGVTTYISIKALTISIHQDFLREHN